MTTVYRENKAEIRAPFKSNEMANTAVELAQNPTALREFNKTLFAHMAIQLFYDQSNVILYNPLSGIRQRGMVSHFDPTRAISIFSEPTPIGSIMVGTRILLEHMDPAFTNELIERIQEKTVRTSVFNFPALQLSRALGNPQVQTGVKQVRNMLETEPQAIGMLLQTMACTLASLVLEGKQLNISGFSGARELFPELTDIHDMVNLIHLTLVLQLREQKEYVA